MRGCMHWNGQTVHAAASGYKQIDASMEHYLHDYWSKSNIFSSSEPYIMKSGGHEYTVLYIPLRLLGFWLLLLLLISLVPIFLLTVIEMSTPFPESDRIPLCLCWPLQTKCCFLYFLSSMRNVYLQNLQPVCRDLLPWREVRSLQAKPSSTKQI